MSLIKNEVVVSSISRIFVRVTTLVGRYSYTLSIGESVRKGGIIVSVTKNPYIHPNH